MAASYFTRSCLPVRLHIVADSCKKSPFHSFFENVIGKIRSYYPKKSTLPPENFRPQHRLPVEFFEKNGVSKISYRKFFSYRPGSVYNRTSRWASNSLASAVAREWSRKVLQRGRGPMLCFVGFALAKKPSLLTEDEERESLTYSIRESFSSIPWHNIGLNIDKNCGFNRQFSLADIKIGEMLAKGCNAAVYSARFADKNIVDISTSPDCKISSTSFVNQENSQSTSSSDVTEFKYMGDRNSLLRYSKLIISHSEGEEMQHSRSQSPPEDLDHKSDSYNLAVKVMFNYNAESNAYAIWSAMNKETLPCIGEFCLDGVKQHRIRKRLKPHPNVVEMYFAFADQVPLLPGAYKNFPHALPVRLLNNGAGRNMTLFLVMKRYQCSLRDYLSKEHPSPRVRLLLFTQLLEALVHLQQSEVAHRDLKTDNILLDLTHDPASPKLAVTDFGCCLESLSLNYPSPEISKGGNMALMAPEVTCAEASPFSQIDYSRSDLWSAGALAYEMFGAANPFTEGDTPLDSASYSEAALPPLPKEAPPALGRLVRDMLRRDPKKRPSPNFAATVCQLLLHSPPELLTKSPSPTQHLEWMFLLSARTYLEGSLPGRAHRSVEFELRHAFCSRIQYLEVTEAFRYIHQSS